MTDNDEGNNASDTVAPGYPVISTLKDLDVSGWEPAAIFRPVTSPDVEEDSSEDDMAGDGA